MGVAGWIGGIMGYSVLVTLHLGVREWIPRIIQESQSNFGFSNGHWTHHDTT